MKLQQLRYVVEVFRHDNHLSAAADFLNTSQSGVSKQIQLLEAELGFSVFQRKRNRILGLTEPGRRIIEIARRVIGDIESLKAVRDDFATQDEGSLTIATTHTPARYILPEIIEKFVLRYPMVKIGLRQGNPTQICEMVETGDADIAIGTETSQPFPNLVRMPCMQLSRCVVAKRGHPILRAKQITLSEIAKYPVITHDPAFSGRWRVMEAFRKQGLKPQFIFGIVDADVSKAYVERGFGIAILSAVSVDAKRDTGLQVRDVGHLLEPNTAYISLRKSGYFRQFVFDFINQISPELTPDRVASLLNGTLKKTVKPSRNRHTV
jgi:LysR family transcriptional regulator, cys regulon transcriptional activator